VNEYADPQPKEATVPARTVPPVVHEVLRSPGQQLDTNTRNAVEPRFGHDFSRVRVHTDAKAAQSARAVDALAYTVGSDVVFGANRYSPETPDGQRLLAHELAHVVQQEGSREDVPGTLRLDSASDAPEKVADEAAKVYGAEESSLGGSATLRVRHRLRSTRPATPTIQRAVSTWAGDWDTDKYDIVKTKAGTESGVDIELRFEPGKYVNTEKIGMVQMVNSKSAGKVLALNKTVAARSIPAGKPGEGSHIDQLESYRSPLYATGKTSAKDTLASTPTEAVWGRHGWRYTDKAGKLHKQDALLKDTPQLPPAADASQIFETTALAIAGHQEGTYYGSVRWGWETNAAGKFTKLPLSVGSNDVPSGVFTEAAKLWNTTPTSKGTATIGLPTVAGKYTNTEGVLLVNDPSKAKSSSVGKLAKNTRLEVTDKGAARAFNKGAATQWWQVTIVDGTHIGKVGWIMETMLSDSKTP
jgi:hypothetical protein